VDGRKVVEDDAGEDSKKREDGSAVDLDGNFEGTLDAEGDERRHLCK